jgi:ferredoxin hydrogenase
MLLNIYKNSQTEKDLMKALEDESVAHAKYQIYSRIAGDEGLQDVSDYFGNAANDELGHAEMWMKELGLVGDTKQNLETAINGEVADQPAYRKAASDAAKEGYDDLSKRYLLTADVENRHEKGYRDYLEKLNANNQENPNVATAFRCINCGYETRGLYPPEICPLCGYPKRYFRRYYINLL